MSQKTRQEVLSQMRRRYLRAGRRYKPQLVSQLVELFGYHRKAVLRALRPKSVLARAPFARGRPPGIRAGATAAAAQGHLAGGPPTLWRASQGLLAGVAGRLRGRPSPAGCRHAPSVAVGQPRHAGSAAQTRAHRASASHDEPARPNYCAGKFPSAPTGPKRFPVTWSWTRWRCAAQGRALTHFGECRLCLPHTLERLARPAQPQRSQCLRANGRLPAAAALPVARVGQRPVC
jgi:hypothetical protein